MLSTASPLMQPGQLEAKVTLRGVSWITFKALMADVEGGNYRIAFSSEALEIRMPLLDSNEQDVGAANKITLRGIRWQTYKALIADVQADRIWRIAYDQGVLEIRMPQIQHEEPKGLIEDFVTAIADELDIEVRKLGALTLEREDLMRAVEPDTCFYIQNEYRVRGLEELNFPNDPPPDLIVESDHTRSSINKFTIYASLGVPELWRYRKQTLEVYQLIGGKYERCSQSLALPLLPVAEVPELIERSRKIGQRATVRVFRQRIQEIRN